MRSIPKFLTRVIATLRLAARPESEPDTFEQLASDELRRRLGRARLGGDQPARRTYYSRQHPSHRPTRGPRPEHVAEPKRLGGD